MSFAAVVIAALMVKPENSFPKFRALCAEVQVAASFYLLLTYIHGAEPYRILAVKHRILVVIFGLYS